MKNKLITLAWVFASIAAAQPGAYLGPGVLTRGAGNIGDRSGQQVDLRFFADVSGVYDNGIQPFALDSKGNLLQVIGLYGVQAQVGAYGSHRWSRALLGLDYNGTFYHYNNASFYDGSNHNLALGYTYQKSRRLSFDFRQIAGESSLGYGGPGFYGAAYAPPSDIVNTPTTLLFDNRTYYLQSSMDVNYIPSARTMYTFGGDGFLVRRHANGLANVSGYSPHGSIKHRISRARTIGINYEHSHYDFAPAFGESDMDMVQGAFSTSLGRRWTLALYAGGYKSEVQSIQQVALSPEIAALLGQSVTFQRTYRVSYYPGGNASLSGVFKTSSVTFAYSKTVVPGNGVYLTSRQDSALGSYSYTGVRKWNFGITGGYSALHSIGQSLNKYGQLSGGAGITYAVVGSLHVVARYDARHQEIDLAGYRRTSYRATIGFAFSPGKVPLSLW